MRRISNFLFLLFSFFFLFSSFSSAQVGGTSVYNFLKIPTSARSASTGGNLISVNDTDFALVIDNPSLINSGMHNHIMVNYINYVSDINLGYAAYARNFKYIGTVVAGLQYLNYGKFTQTNIYDEKIGEFSAGDYALNLSFAKKLHPQILSGGTIKGIYSTLFENKSYGIAADLASTFISKNNSFAAALVFKNMGAQIKTYSRNINELLPFEVQLGVSKKIKYAPIRIIFNLKNLQNWNLISFQKINYPQSSQNNQTNKKAFDWGYNLVLHSSVGIELIPVKGFFLRLGYEPVKRREMELVNRSGLIGFSLGAGIRILKMNFSYARSSYHFAGASNHITLSTSISEFSSRKNNTVLFDQINP